MIGKALKSIFIYGLPTSHLIGRFYKNYKTFFNVAIKLNSRVDLDVDGSVKL